MHALCPLGFGDLWITWSLTRPTWRREYCSHGYQTTYSDGGDVGQREPCKGSL